MSTPLFQLFAAPPAPAAKTPPSPAPAATPTSAAPPAPAAKTPTSAAPSAPAAKTPASPAPPASAAKTSLFSAFAEAQRLRALYPNLNPAALLSDPESRRCIQALQLAGAPDPVRTVYEARHRDEVLAGLTAAVSRNTMDRLAAAVAANRARPAENGMQQGGALTGADIRKLTPAQRAQIRKRVREGEKISF